MNYEQAEELRGDALRHFSPESRQLVDDMVAAGWRGKLSSKGHAVMYAPDGVTSQTFAPKDTYNRGARNARARFNRWLREQSEPAPTQLDTEGSVAKTAEKATAAETPSEPVRCDICNRPFKNLHGMHIHRKRHEREREECPKCGAVVAFLDTHLAKAHTTDTHELLSLMMDAFDELERLREENKAYRKLHGDLPKTT